MSFMRNLVVYATLTSPLALAACSTTGGPPSEPAVLPHNGTGPYRDLDEQETGGSAVGILVELGAQTPENGMLAADRSLFYAAAMYTPPAPVDAGRDAPSFDAGPDVGPVDVGPLEDAPLLVDAGTDAHVVATDANATDAGMVDAGPTGPAVTNGPDWSRHAARRIYRSEGVSESMGYSAGTLVLEPTEAWEGTYVTDPWALRAGAEWRLYYATVGGIGVATAETPMGPYRHRAAPIVAATPEASPRRPTVIETSALAHASHPFLMYYEVDGHIEAQGSQDGIEFDPIGRIELDVMAARDRRDGVEESIGGPAAVVVTSPSGRSFVRLYYESRRSNAGALITLAGSENGDVFENFGRPVVNILGRRFAAPYELSDRVSLLVQWAPPGRSAPNQGQLFIGIAPAGHRLAPEEMMMPTP